MFESLERDPPAAMSLADRVAGTPAGPALLALLLALAERFPPTGRAAVRGLARPDPDEPTADGELAVRIMQGWERMSCWVAAQQQLAIVAVAGPTRSDDDDWPVDEIGAALRLSPGIAISRVCTARALTGRLAATRVAVADGRFPIWYATHLAEQLDDRSDAVAAAVQASVLIEAGAQTYAQFRRAVAKALAAADPQTLEERHAAAAEQRRVMHYANDNAMGAVLIEAPITTTAAFYDALTSYATRAIEGDQRTLDQRRADTLDELTSWLRAAPGFPTTHGRRRQLGVLIDWDTLRGLADQPGELAGYGPIPASLARGWAADADWRRWTTDPVTGYLLDYGSTVYRPPADLREYVIARDRTCRFPARSTPAHRADLDHAIPHGPTGGHTSSANVTALGGRPHRAKHEAGWQLLRHPLGECDWTSPAGLHHRTEPANHHWMRGQPPPDHTGHHPPDTADLPDTGDPPDTADPPDVVRRHQRPAANDPDPPPDATGPDPPPF